MTFKIKMLTAAAVLSLPIAAGAQVTAPATPPAGQTVDQTADQAQDAANDAAQSAQDAATSSATAQAQADAQAGPVTQATAADIQAGAAVRDQSGGLVGTVESVSADGVVVSTGTVRAQVPIASFGKNAQGLVLAMTKAQLEAAAGAQSPSTPS